MYIFFLPSLLALVVIGSIQLRDQFRVDRDRGHRLVLLRGSRGLYPAPFPVGYRPPVRDNGRDRPR